MPNSRMPAGRAAVVSLFLMIAPWCLSASAAEAGGGPPKLKYPPARIESVTDGRLGVTFADPYRWLEENTQEVRDWQVAQAKLADDYVQAWPHFANLRRQMQRYVSSSNSSIEAPRSYAKGKWYLLKSKTQIVEVPDLSAGSASKARVIVDLTLLGLGGTAVITWFVPSPDATVIAFGVVTDGSEANTIHLVDLATGKLVDKAPKQRLAEASGVQWLTDSSGFFFQGLTKTLHDFEIKTYLHRLRPAVETQLQSIPLPKEGGAFSLVTVSRDGRWAVLTARALSPIPHAIKDLSRPDSDWRPFVSDAVSGTVAGYVLDGKYIAVTDVGAPRGRVVAIPLDSPAPSDPKTWTELVPQSDRVLRGLTPIQDKLYLSEYLDTYARVRIVDRAGQLHGEVPLPGNGVVEDAIQIGGPVYYRGNPDEYIYSYASLTSAAALYRYRPGQSSSELLAPPAASLKDAVVKDLWVASSDGTRIPYHVVHRRSLDLSRPKPVLIYGYGGFNGVWAPRFPDTMATFVDAGGIFVHANLRGGGELGRQWWDGGRLKNKQNTFQDLYAIANALIAAGWTSRDLLAVTGVSNGGLLAGVAVVQQPALWRVSVPRVPILDLIGGLRDPYGYAGIKMDYADPEDPAELRRLEGFSPYQLVRNGTRYPSVYLLAGDTDFRTPPWHARKFAARLQAATASSSPILLRVWDNAGHGAATAGDIRLNQDVHWMAFVMKELGMQPNTDEK